MWILHKDELINVSRFTSITVDEMCVWLKTIDGEDELVFEFDSSVEAESMFQRISDGLAVNK